MIACCQVSATLVLRSMTRLRYFPGQNFARIGVHFYFCKGLDGLHNPQCGIKLILFIVTEDREVHMLVLR